MSVVAARTFLCFDYGLKRIGVAVGQELTGTASALTTVTARNGKPDWPTITRLFEEWRPDAVVVGLPLNMDGTDHELSRRARRFGNQLHGRYNLPTHFIDERLSSLEAESLLKDGLRQKKHSKKDDIDKLAAKVILETWLAESPPQPQDA